MFGLSFGFVADWKGIRDWKESLASTVVDRFNQKKCFGLFRLRLDNALI